MNFLDRKADIERLNEAFGRKNPQFVVVYGRRRIGKSTLIKKVLDADRGDVYFLCDQTSESHQRFLFSRSVSLTVEGFDKVTYPDWEVLFEALNRQLTRRVKICLDEFPYLVKSCPSLKSVLQKLLNGKTFKFDLIICGSSQQLMQGLVLDKKEPLYGLADEIIKLQPIPPGFIAEALGCDAVSAVEEYAIWGGIPRYWELRREYVDRETAIRKMLLDTQGILADEPQRLLRDDLRETIQTTTLLSLIGNGVHRSSEIAARVGKEATSITEPLSKLRELGFIRREIPFGENEKTSKKGIYRIDDPLTEFYFRFVAPYRSLLEFGRIDTIMQIVNEQFPGYAGDCWEHLCRHYVSGNMIDGIAYKMASRWWGKIFPPGYEKEGKMTEIDVLAESFDKKHILIGECKWTGEEDAARLKAHLEETARYLPFIKKNHTVHIVLFLKQPPRNGENAQVMLPQDVLGLCP